jgi:hypothetical protein
VNPSALPNNDPQDLEAATESLEQQVYGVGTPQTRFAWHLQYRDWWRLIQAQQNNTQDVGIADDVANGRVPVISLSCGDDNPNKPHLTLNDIIAGNADSDIIALKNQFASFKYPDGTQYPIIVRYFWEFNVNAANPGGNANGNGGCFTGNRSTFASEFTQAWNHIHAVMAGTSPIPNLTWDWNPNVVSTAQYPSPPVDPVAFYPGTGSVDWIGADGYQELDGEIPEEPKTFPAIFSGWYGEFNGYGKPMMIGETGSCQYYDTQGAFNTDQIGYLQTLQSTLDNIEPAYPNIRALLYFDADGLYQPKGQPCNWWLSPAILGNDTVSGIQQFSTLANDAFFGAKVTEP